jgi:hypothetical protein
MSLHAQISLITVPQEFTRLCNAVLAADHGHDFLPIDDDRADGGNDGYLKSERRLYAMHCFKRVQNQSLEAEIRKKMLGDLRKAITLDAEGRWDVASWTFISNYPVPEDIATEVVEAGRQASIEVGWAGPDYLADGLQRHESIRAQFPALQVNEISEQLQALQKQIGGDSVPVPTEDSQALDVESPGRTASVTVKGDRTLVESRPGGWEYLWFASILREGKADLELKRREHETRVPAHPRSYLADDEVFRYLSRRFNEISTEIEVMMRVFDPSSQEEAFGAPGEEGDPVGIEHFARRILAAYEHLMDWAAAIRGQEVDELYRDLFEAAARYADQPIREIATFIDELVTKTELIPGHLADDRPDRPRLVIEVDLVLTISQDDQDAVQREMERVRRVLL